jgi:hypothetical protein
MRTKTCTRKIGKFLLGKSNKTQTDIYHKINKLENIISVRAAQFLRAIVENY